jgi:hypothetical protein
MLVTAHAGIPVMLLSAILSYFVLAIIGYLTIFRWKAGVPMSEIVNIILIPVSKYYAIALILLWIEFVGKKDWIDVACSFIFVCVVVVSSIFGSSNWGAFLKRTAV